MNKETLTDIRVASNVVKLRENWDTRLDEPGYDYHVPYGNTSPGKI